MKSTKTALAITLAVMVIATLFGSHRSLNAVRKEALSVFTQGAAGDGVGVRSDLENRANACANLCAVARNNGLEGEGSVVALKSLVEQFRAGDLDAPLAEGAQAVIDLLDPAYLDRESRQDLSDLKATLTSIAMKISRDPYTDLAWTFDHKTLSAFPANVLGGLTGVKPLPIYQ